MSTLLWVLGSLAIAGDSAPIETVPVSFPWAGLDFGVDSVSCVARARVAADGQVQQVSTERSETCPEPFAAAVDAAVGQYRYPAAEQERDVEVPFRWRLKSSAWPTMTPAELQRVIAAHEPLPLEVDGCELRIAIAPDGSIRRLRSSAIPECLVMPLGPGRNPKRLRKDETDKVRCTARFTSDRGVASDVFFENCPERWELPADIALRNWQWQTTGGVRQDYVVRFVFLLE